jgi:hypothetical protein
MVVETPQGFVAPGPLQVPLDLGPAMGKPVGRGFRFGFSPFGPLPRGSQVNDGAHWRSMAVLGW